MARRRFPNQKARIVFFITTVLIVFVGFYAFRWATNSSGTTEFGKVVVLAIFFGLAIAYLVDQIAARLDIK